MHWPAKSMTTGCASSFEGEPATDGKRKRKRTDKGAQGEPNSKRRKETAASDSAGAPQGRRGRKSGGERAASGPADVEVVMVQDNIHSGPGNIAEPAEAMAVEAEPAPAKAEAKRGRKKKEPMSEPVADVAPMETERKPQSPCGALSWKCVKRSAFKLGALTGSAVPGERQGFYIWFPALWLTDVRR